MQVDNNDAVDTTVEEDSDGEPLIEMSEKEFHHIAKEYYGDQVKTGHGTREFESGAHYSGDLVNNVMHGEGTMKYVVFASAWKSMVDVSALYAEDATT